MLSASAFLDLCHARGVRFITGTPCSYLKPLINAAIDDDRFRFRDAVNEGDAVAMAAGAVAAAARPLVMFQNSGLGNAVNALTSLLHPFRIPILMIITHRGEPGGEPDEPQHEQMGRITTRLLDSMEIPWARFPSDPAAAASSLDHAFAAMDANQRPFALIMSKDAVAPCALRTKLRDELPPPRRLELVEHDSRLPSQRMSRTEALQSIRSHRQPEDVHIATTGYTGRELYALGDDPWNLYLVGSMGSACSFGLGLALHLSDHRVTVIDGDGALLMRMGNLATLGAYGPETLLHVVLDNEAHDSTGGQATVSRGVAFAAIAQACGYRRVFSTDAPTAFAQALSTPRQAGPTFIHLRIRPGAPATLPRPKTSPHEVFLRLKKWLRRN